MFDLCREAAREGDGAGSLLGGDRRTRWCRICSGRRPEELVATDLCGEADRGGGYGGLGWKAATVARRMRRQWEGGGDDGGDRRGGDGGGGGDDR